MAEAFGDNETMEKILAAPTTPKAEEAMKEIKGFDENTWNGVCLSVRSVSPSITTAVSVIACADEDDGVGDGPAIEGRASAMDREFARLHRQDVYRRRVAG